MRARLPVFLFPVVHFAALVSPAATSPPVEPPPTLEQVLSPAGQAQASGGATTVPGVVIDHRPASSGIYIGSPSLATFSTTDYVASHDEFGPNSTEHTLAVTWVFTSSDSGRSWTNLARIDGQFWSTLFVHDGRLYLIGTDRHHGRAIIRRSNDRGRTWTSPDAASTGLLSSNTEFHCAPVPVTEHAGRLWRGIERRVPPRGWGITYCAGVFSVPMDADLLNASNWTFSDFLPGNTNWLGGSFGGWLEGNVLEAPDGHLVDLLRVDTPGLPEKAAMVRVTPDGKSTAFDPLHGFVNFPGGAKKFTVQFDRRSRLYWSLASIVTSPPRSGGRPAGLRNTLALVCSLDLVTWTIRSVLLQHPDATRHGFQYVDWHFEGEDLIAVCRTAYDDGEGGAHNAHDANYLTFHRMPLFRSIGNSTGAAPATTK
jgi:hypothetical protein